MMKYKKAVRRLKLYENGKLIGPVSWRHRLMWQNGTLGFSCWGGALSLTTQDNSHPGENGRQCSNSRQKNPCRFSWRQTA